MPDDKLSFTLTLTGDNVPPKVLQNEIVVLMQYLKSSHLDLSISQLTNSKETGSTTKGDPVTLGALLLVIAPAILPQILAFIEKMVTEGRKVEIQAPNGAKITFVPNKKNVTRTNRGLPERAK